MSWSRGRAGARWCAGVVAAVVFGIAAGVSSSPAAAQLPLVDGLLKPSVTAVDVPSGWVGHGGVPVAVSAHGSLLGVRSIELEVPAGTAPRVRTYPCLIDSVALCPMDWTQAFAIADADLAEGASVLRATVLDAAGTRSTPVERTVRVDRSAPLLDVSGELRDAANGWLADRAYDVGVVARDGSAAQLRSGVRSVELLVDGARHGFVEQECAAGSCALERTLTLDAAALGEGVHDVTVVAVDQIANRSEQSWRVGVDRRVPLVALSGALAQADGTWLDGASTLHVDAGEPAGGPAGSGVESIEVVVDGVRAHLERASCTSGGCSLQTDWTLDPAGLDPGWHLVQVLVLDEAGQLTQRSLTVGVDPDAPELVLSDGLADADGRQLAEAEGIGVRASDAVSGVVRLEVLLDGARKRLVEQPCPDGGCELASEWTLETQGLADGEHTLAVIARDAAGREARREIAFVWRPFAPPTAPALADTEITPFVEQTAFLYTGVRPVQTGMDPATISERRAAVIRGQVRDRAGAPIGGAKITVLGHPEYGQARSRDDGEIYMAVNGGGMMTVRIEHPDFLPVDRQVDVPWQDYAQLPDAVLIKPDPNVTAVALGAAATQLVVHRGSREVDGAGSRQATLLFPAGIEADMEMPDGTTRAFDGDVHVRATEYTVGQTGPDAMPGPLPATSAYTYAADFAVDEARTAGAAHVRFTKPVIGYLENFRNAPVGARVPNGYYERRSAQWVPDTDGRVIKILSESDGNAVIDVTGSGAAASQASLDTLGISDDERRTLAELYAPGQELWRVPTRHFSDWNHGFVILGQALASAPFMIKKALDDPCTDSGSVIECENQTLGEDIALTGSGLGLHYRSDRQIGRTAGMRTIDIPLTDATLPTGLRRVELEIQIAGRVVRRSYSPQPNLTHHFEWDATDVFGRRLQGAAKAKIRVGYSYAISYSSDQVSVEDQRKGFGIPAAPTSGQLFTWQINVDTAGGMQAPTITVWTDTDTTLGGWDARGAGLGGWSPSTHHQYDPVARTLYRGDGTRQSVQSVNRVIDRFAGVANQPGGSSPSGGKATESKLHGPDGMDVGPDGSVYIADWYNDVIRRVRPDGIMEIVAGRQRPSYYAPRGYGGDGGPATQADLYIPKDVAVAADGSLYIADYGNHRVRKVDPQGIITTVAGRGDAATTPLGDGGPATQASILYPSSVAVAADGTLFLGEGDRRGYRVRRVGTDGVITTYAGGGTAFPNTAGMRATDAEWSWWSSPGLDDIALDGDGNLYVVKIWVYMVSPDGTMTRVANGGYGTPAGETRAEVPAMEAKIQARSVDVAPDGSVYLLDRANDRLWRLDRDKMLRVVAGGGNPTSGFGDGGPAREAKLDVPNAVTAGLDGSLYVSDWGLNTVRRTTTTMPGFSGTDIALPSQDGSELYRFDETGRHLQTLSTATGVVTQTFGYDSAGRLSTITDEHDNTLRVERNTAGDPVAMIAPFGQRTNLELDSNGYLASVTDPAGRATTIDYAQGGLLNRFGLPGGRTSTMTYDGEGRLTRDTNADGAYKTLSRTDGRNHYEVTVATRLGRTRTHRVAQSGADDQTRTVTGPDGLQTTTVTRTDGSATTTGPDGSKVTTGQAADPRFGLQAPITSSVTTTRPSGATATARAARSVDQPDRDDPLSTRSITDTVTIGARVTTTRWDKSARTLTTTLPSGRAATSTFDALGRLVRSEQPGVSAVTYRYDSHGRPIEVVQGQRSATSIYDADGWLDTSTDPLGRTTRYTRDALGRITKTTLPDGREVRVSYTAAGDVQTITPPSRPAHNFLFTLAGLRDAWTAAGDPAAVTRYRYDDDQQLTAIERPDGSTINVDHDSAGRVSALRHGTWAVDYDYNPSSGRLAGVTADDGTRTAWTYDGALPLTETTTGTVAGQTTFAYDNEGRLTSSTVAGTPAVTYDYDPDGAPTRIGALTMTRNQTSGQLTATTLDASSTALAYNSYGELDGLSAAHDGAPRFSEAYARDDAGRVVGKTEQIGGQTHTYAYAYDPAGRLATVTRDGTTIASYEYDSNGNRSREDLAGQAPVTADYDDQDRLQRHGSTTYRYTSNGELRERTTATGASTMYAYDAAGSLTTVDLADGRTVSYSTDGLGRRIATKINGTLTRGFLYGEGALPSAETDGDGQIRSRFVYATRSHVPDYMQRAGRTYRLIADQLGSVRLVVDTQTGDIAQRIDYDPYGAITTDTNPGFQPFAYAGGLYDTDTGLVRFGARDYDPQTGRWTAKDPIDFAGGDTNLYGYVHGDPINLIDPSGLIVDTIADVGFIAYDLYQFARGCGNVAALGADVGAALIPFVTGAGLGVRGAQSAAKAGFTAPKVARTASGEVTNGTYTVSRVPQARHTTGSTTSGKSQFLFRIDADQAVLDAAAYADEAGLWVNNKAKVLVENGPVGVHGASGQLTSYINIYRTKGGYVHGAPGRPPR